MIEVKDKNGNVRCNVEITDKCVYAKTLMEEEYVLLSFESDVLINFAKKDYISTEFGTFYIMEIARPQRQSDGGYLYEQKFVADWMFWANRILFYDRQAGYECSWKLTQRPEYFLDIVVSNLKDAGFGTYSFDIDASLTEMKLVEFDSTSIIDALTAIAEEWETEWWVADNVIHLSKCEFGSAVSLTDGDELSDMESDAGQDTTRITRAYVFGSTRNLPKNYRKDDSSSVVIEGVVETRLKLPSGIPYIDAWEDMKEEDIVEGVIVIDDVYPRNVGTISTITTKEYTDEIENEDGTKTYEKWNAYRFTDLSMPTFKSEYRLADEDLRIVFQTGKLAGMDFVVNFNPDDVPESSSASQVFEIVRNDDYGVDLPSDTFCPEVGDTFILYGYDTQYVYDNLVTKAEQELYTKAVAKVAELSADKNVYTCTANPLRCAGYKPNGIGKMVHTAADEIDLGVGQSVMLKSDTYFDSSYRLSRVRGFEKRLDNKYNCTYTIGESSIYSRTTDLQEQVDELTYQSKQFVNTYGNSVYVVKRYDKTAPSDTNVPSFLRAQYEFLQRNVPNTAEAKITFKDGLISNGNVAVEGNITADNVTAQAMETVSAVVKELLTSESFRSGLTGEGFGLTVDGENISTLEVDKLTVRQTMRIFELLVDKVRSTSGTIVASAGNGKVESVADDGTYYTLTFDNGNEFVVGDLIRCQNYNGTDVKSYWVEVAEAGTDYVKVKKSEFDENVSPAEGDEVVLMGNSENATRQSLVTISASEGGVPAIDIYREVNSKSLAGKLSTRLGVLDGIADNAFPYDNQPQGVGLYSDNAYLKGTFLLSTGEDIKTKFEVTEGKVESAIEGVRSDFLADKGYLSNPTFASGLEKWNTENETVFFLVGNKWVWANNNVLSKKGDGASVVSDLGRTVVHIRNKYIQQLNSNLRYLPTFDTNTDGQKEAIPVYLSFFYRCAKAGTLKVYFENVDKTGFADFDSMNISEAIAVSDGYMEYTCNGLWNGTGDFRLEFDGDIYLYALVFSTDKADSLEYKYKTLFEQSEQLAKLSAAVYGSDKSLLKESGLMVTADYAGLYAVGADGNLKSLVGAGQDGVKIKAESIELEGEITANGEFAVDKWGNVKTGTQYGITTSQYIVEDKSNLIFTSDAAITLPNDKEYIGRRLLIVSQPKHSSAGVVISSDNQGITDVANFPKVDITTGEVFVKGVYGITSSDGATEPSTIVTAAGDDNSPMKGVKWFGGNCAYKGEQYFQTPSKLTIQGGYIELLGVSYPVARTFRTQYAQLTADGADALVYQVKMARYDADGHVTYDTPYSEEYTIADADESGATITDNGTIIHSTRTEGDGWEAVSEMCMWVVINVNAINFNKA